MTIILCSSLIRLLPLQATSAGQNRIKLLGRTHRNLNTCTRKFCAEFRTQRATNWVRQMKCSLSEQAKTKKYDDTSEVCHRKCFISGSM